MGTPVLTEYHWSSTNGELDVTERVVFYISYVCLTMSNKQKLK